MRMVAVNRSRPSLVAEGLVQSFGDGERRRILLNELSMELYPGQFALLMGPSGSGKSTLLAVLSGLLAPESGRVLAIDRQGPGDYSDVWSLSKQQRERFRLANTGFIFQGYNLFPALTAMQQLEIVLSWGTGPRGGAARRKSDEMLEKLGLSGCRNKTPSQLSGGEKQRVAIGRALVKDPMFIFADEPTSALDWENGQHVVQLLRDAAHTRGATIFAVTHDSRLLPYADVCYHLDGGKMTADHTPGNGSQANMVGGH
ncbi:MAG: ABC transporter ATP-binding protein [Gemmataceae bacterium]